MTITTPVADTDDAADRRAADAMRRNNMLIGMVCENMLSGRDAFFGTGQFIAGEAKP